MIKSVALAVLVLSAVSTEAVAASLHGQIIRITGEVNGNVAVGPLSPTVGDGLEVPGRFWGIYEIDLSDTSILFTFPGSCCGGFTPAEFSGIHFFDVTGNIGEILSVTIGSSNVAGFNAGRISFNADNVFVNFASLNPDPVTGSVLLNLTTTASAPEPSAWLLMAGGTAMLFRLRRRKQ